MSLARTVDLRADDLKGKTWAGYIAESTRGQADRYGPEIQRAEQATFADRHGLRPTRREYVDLVSGKDTLRRTDFARMLADAETGAFEVLLCYDTSRFARNVADAWTYREQLARCGVIVVFCADGLISGNVDTYELEGLKTVADAAYIRRLSRNVGNGYAQKWRLYSDREAMRRSASRGWGSASCWLPSKGRISIASGVPSSCMPPVPGATRTWPMNSAWPRRV